MGRTPDTEKHSGIAEFDTAARLIGWGLFACSATEQFPLDVHRAQPLLAGNDVRSPLLWCLCRCYGIINAIQICPVNRLHEKGLTCDSR
jgi:hypothetical protein